MSWADHPRSERSDRAGSPDAESSDGETDRTGSETAVLELLREESRAVVSEQIALLREIDEKAMRTVRTVVLVVSLLTTATQFGWASALGRVGTQLAAGGVGLLVISLVVGVYTYSVSGVEFGVGREHRREALEARYTHREWLQLQLSEYDQWTAAMTETNTRNARLLQTTLVTAVFGVFALLVATVVSLDVSGRALWAGVATAVGVYLLLVRQKG